MALLFVVSPIHRNNVILFSFSYKEEKASVDMDSVQGIVKNTEGILDNPPNFTSHPPPLIHAGTDDDGRNIKRKLLVLH